MTEFSTPGSTRGLEIFKDELKKLNEMAPSRSNCKRKSVGCGIYHARGLAICRDFNGMTLGCTDEVGRCGCVHAEVNAIIRIGHMYRFDSDYLKGSVMVCSYSPCTNCANLIQGVGFIRTVYYGILTEHDKRGVEILRKQGIQVIHIGD